MSAKKVEKLSSNIQRLADWYAQNKPNVRAITISAADAADLERFWTPPSGCKSFRQDCINKGFYLQPDGSMRWREFDLRKAG